MGFGFSLFVLFILLPITIILLIAWLVFQKKIIGIVLGSIWLLFIILIVLLSFSSWVRSKTVLDKKDYQGEYIINREYFKGPQTDWQYNHFRFEIKENDSIYFYETENETIIKTYKGTIKISNPAIYPSARLIIDMEQPKPHILIDNPTTYRSAWNFYLVFRSPKFYNVFFKKGKWKSIE